MKYYLVWYGMVCVWEFNGDLYCFGVTVLGWWDYHVKIISESISVCSLGICDVSQ